MCACNTGSCTSSRERPSAISKTSMILDLSSFFSGKKNKLFLFTSSYQIRSLLLNWVILMKYFLQDLLNHIELYLDSLNSQILTSNFAHREPNGRIVLVCPHYSVCLAEGLGKTTTWAKRCDITCIYVSDNMRKARRNYFCYKYREFVFAIDKSFCRPVGCSKFW